MCKAMRTAVRVPLRMPSEHATCVRSFLRAPLCMHGINFHPKPEKHVKTNDSFTILKFLGQYSTSTTSIFFMYIVCPRQLCHQQLLVTQ